MKLTLEECILIESALFVYDKKVKMNAPKQRLLNDLVAKVKLSQRSIKGAATAKKNGAVRDG